MAYFSGVDVYTALAGATGALYGPLHGGANEVKATLICFYSLSSANCPASCKDSISKLVTCVSSNLQF